MASWPVVGQFSSIGSLGASADGWLRGEWLDSMSARCSDRVLFASGAKPQLQLVPCWFLNLFYFSWLQLYAELWTSCDSHEPWLSCLTGDILILNRSDNLQCKLSCQNATGTICNEVKWNKEYAMKTNIIHLSKVLSYSSLTIKFLAERGPFFDHDVVSWCCDERQISVAVMMVVECLVNVIVVD